MKKALASRIRKWWKVIVALIAIVLAVAIIFVLERRNNDVIDMDAEVVRLPDVVSEIEIDSAGGKKRMIQVRFTWEIDGFEYADAIVISPEEYAALDVEDIDRLKDERFERWVKAVNEQSKVPGAPEQAQ